MLDWLIESLQALTNYAVLNHVKDESAKMQVQHKWTQISKGTDIKMRRYDTVMFVIIPK